MGSEVAIIGEVLISAISALLLWAKEKGLSDEEANSLIIETLIRVRQTKPEKLPDV